MENEEKQAVEQTTEEVVDTSPVSEAQAHEESAEVQPQGEPQTPKNEDINNQAESGEQKSTRAERRISKLIDKLKAKDEPHNTQPVFDPNAPLIDPQADQIDPNQFNQTYQQHRYADRELVKRELKAEMQYEKTVEDHLSDAESTAKEINDDKVEAFIAQRYEEINNVYDPRTGQFVFVPRVKMSDLYKDLKGIIDKQTVSAQADVTAKISRQAEESAAPISGKSQSTQDYEGEAMYEKALNSNGNPEIWAEVIKKRLFK